MAEKISKKCELSIDIIDAKILNFTPSHFLNNVFKNGTVLLSKNEKLLSSIIEETSLTAVANEFFIPVAERTCAKIIKMEIDKEK